jgi:3',5'-nucleoside bisphosphate phosphatase
VKFADLHLHTSFSDGTYTPLELIRAAGNAGLSAIAVVDHDTVEAIDPSLDAAVASGMEVIPGIELTAVYEGLEVHILGYLIDYKDRQFLERLKALKANRIERIYRIAEKLKEMGVNLDPAAVFDIAGKGSVGRLHVARAMVAEGIVSTVAGAFQQYIGDRCPAYVLGFKLSVAEAVSMIKSVGGIPVLAHPYTLNKDETLYQIIGAGVMGIEAYYPEHSQSMINFYLNIAEKYNLLVTGGSDCHGSAKPEIKVGLIKLPYTFVEGLKKAKGS